MINDPLYRKLRELGWRRKLTPAEEADLRALLASDAEAQADWEAEAGLSEVLDRLPDVPVPSNFTANVLQTAERERARDQRKARTWNWPWRFGWLPKTALAALVAAAGVFSYVHGQNVRRAELRNSIVAVDGVKSLPGPDILQNFDVIRALDQTPPADEQLLTLLQ
jgi:anti-sigma factor RsiW